MGADRHAPGPVVRALRRQRRARLGDARRRPAVRRPRRFPYAYLQPAVGRSFTSFWSNRDGIRTEYVRAYAGLAQGARRRGRGDRLRRHERARVRARGRAVRPAAPARGGDRSYLVPFYRELVPALRAADRDTPTFYEDWLTTDFGYPFAVRLPTATWASATTSTAASRSAPSRARSRRPRRCATARGNAAANDAAALVTEFGATDKLDVIAARRRRRRRCRRGLAVLAVQDLPGPDDARPPPRGPTPSRSSRPAARSRRPRRGSWRAPIRCGSPGAARAGATARPTGASPCAGRRRRGADTVVAAAAARLPARVRRSSAHGVRVVRRAPLTLRGSGRASITITRR